jgi:hypothetical protein
MGRVEDSMMKMKSTMRIIVGLVLVSALGLLSWSCTTPPTFSDSTNHFVSFNPVFIDSLPGTGRATQVTGTYDANGFAVMIVSQAEYDALPRLWAYQLWTLSKNGSAITSKAWTNKFLWDPVRHVAVQPDGNLIEPRKFNFQTDVTAFQELVLTIEPYPDYFFIRASGGDTLKVIIVDDGVTNNDPTPDLEFLKAPLSASQTVYDLRFETADQFDVDTGAFFLANVTAGTSVPAAVANSANFGIWFGIRNPDGSITHSMTLPTLPSGWMYEGWVEPPRPNPAEPISTGRFTSVSGRDSSDQYSGPLSNSLTLNIPGEDFIQNMPNPAWTFPMNLVPAVGDTGWVYITVEPNFAPFAGLDPQDPSPDISAGPFFYRLLQNPLPDSVPLPVLDPFNLEANTFTLQNMHGQSPKFGHDGAPKIEIQLSSQ